MSYLGDFKENAVISITFNLNEAAGGKVGPSAAFGTSDLVVKNLTDGTTKATANGITITEDVVGEYDIKVDSSVDTGETNFWAKQKDYKVSLRPTPTVDGKSVIRAFQFSIENRFQGSSLNGPGSVERTINITLAGQPIDGADVWVTTDSAGTNTIAGTNKSDTFGDVKFMLDAGTYYVWAQKNNVEFPNPSTLTLT